MVYFPNPTGGTDEYSRLGNDIDYRRDDFIF